MAKKPSHSTRTRSSSPVLLPLYSLPSSSFFSTDKSRRNGGTMPGWHFRKSTNGDTERTMGLDGYGDRSSDPRRLLVVKNPLGSGLASTRNPSKVDRRMIHISPPSLLLPSPKRKRRPAFLCRPQFQGYGTMSSRARNSRWSLLLNRDTSRNSLNKSLHLLPQWSFLPLSHFLSR